MHSMHTIPTHQNNTKVSHSTDDNNNITFKINRTSKAYQVPLRCADRLHDISKQLLWIDHTNTAPYLITKHTATKHVKFNWNNKNQQHPYSPVLSIKSALIAAQQLKWLPNTTQPLIICSKKLLKELALLELCHTQPLYQNNIYVQYNGNHIYILPTSVQWEENSDQLGKIVESMYTKQCAEPYITYELIDAALGEHNLLYSSTCDGILQHDIPEYNLHSGQSIEIKTNGLTYKNQLQQYFSGKRYVYNIACNKDKQQWNIPAHGEWLQADEQPKQIGVRLKRINTIFTYLRQHIEPDQNMHVYSITIDRQGHMDIHKKSLLEVDEYQYISKHSSNQQSNDNNDIDTITNKLSTSTIT